MTLDGWTIAKQMYAGLIPGVNIVTRPRILCLYTLISINDALFNVHAAMAAHELVDIKAMHDILMEYAIPPFSPEKIKKEEVQQMVSLLKKIAPRGKSEPKAK